MLTNGVTNPDATLNASSQLRLPDDPDRLADLARDHTADLAAALVRVTLDEKIADDVLATGR